MSDSYSIMEQLPVDDLAEDEITALAEADFEPRYPHWLYRWDKRAQRKKFSPPAKPSEKDMRMWGDQDAMNWHGVLAKDAESLRMYRMTQEYAFDSPEIQFDAHFSNPEARIQIDGLCGMLQGLDVRIDAPARSAEQLEHNAAKKEAGRYIIEEWQKAHRRGGNGNLKWDMAFQAAMYGRICIYHEPDPLDESMPMSLELIDAPAVSVTPGGDKFGPERVVVRRPATLREVLDVYDPTGNKNLKGRMRQSKMAKSGGDGEEKWPQTLDEEGEIVEVYTRWHKWAEFDGFTVMPVTEHGLGYVPFHFQKVTGELSGASFPWLTKKRGWTQREIDEGFVELDLGLAKHLCLLCV